MIVPGNMRERPRGFDRAALICRVVDRSVNLCTETIELQAAALDLLGNSCLEYGAAYEAIDRLTIARAEIDIVKRIINKAISNEIHDSY